jgi:hypothetical protein
MLRGLTLKETCLVLDPAGSTAAWPACWLCWPGFFEGWAECAAVGVERCIFGVQSVFAAMYGGVSLLIAVRSGCEGVCMMVLLTVGAYRCMNSVQHGGALCAV